MLSKPLICVSILAVLLAASGANCPQVVQQYTQPIPRALPPTPTLQQVSDAINGNSARIQSLTCNRASISTPGFPSLRANLAFQRPRQFRLRGETAITGPEVDLGSNNDLFWFWVKRNQPPAVYYCRHDQFATSQARRVLPVEPEWLIQALGVVTFEPTDQHQGPYPVRSGRLEIRTQQTTSLGPITRIVVVDDSKALVLEQHLYDQQGRRLASAILSKHMRDPVTGVILPRHVELQWPPAQFQMAIDLGDLQVNQLIADQQALWTKPQYQGYTDVDLADPNLRLGERATTRR